MGRLLRIAAIVMGSLGVLALLAMGGLRLRYGGGGEFPDRTGPPALPGSALEIVASLPDPPGNIAVSATGRIFFTYHPEAAPEIAVAELVGGRPVPYPRADTEYQSVLSIRIDARNRLWALDNANHGLGQARLLGFDLADGDEIHRYDFPGEIAGLGSHLNDFQVHPQGRWIFIADASFFAQTPALVIYDIERRGARRLLEGHPSVTAQKYVPVVQGRKMVAYGLVAIRPGVDSIALDRAGEWLYFAPVTNLHLYRVRVGDLLDESLSAEQLGARVERWAAKTMSDGISTDASGTVYLTDLEHDAIVALGPDGRLRTLIRDPRLRWPDGLSFGPDGWLYVTCSSLHHVIGRSAAHRRAHAPYQIVRFRPGGWGAPGH